MELYFLGTGAGLPSMQRNVSSIALTLYDERGTMWMFDCGEGTQQQLMNSPLRLARLEKLFITHLHGDHIFGIPGLLASRSSQGSNSPLTIYGPQGLKLFIDTVLKVSQSHLQYPMNVVEISDGVIFSDESFTVYCGLIDHGITSYGYRIEEHDVPGTFFPEKAKAAGLKEGPLFAKLKRKERLELEDGTILDGNEFVSDDKPGRIVAIAGDTKPCAKMVELARNADVLVHEATFVEEHRLLAKKYNHSTALQAAQVANEANVNKLLLTHLSARYQGPTEHLLLKEARATFTDTQIAYDHFQYKINRRS
jgi:ribonuclease Z